MGTVTLPERSAAVNPLALIGRIVSGIELTPTQLKEAKASYEAVAEVLSKPNSPVRLYFPDIFAQGSMRLGTTVRPIGRDAFDLDMVCYLLASGLNFTPKQIYELVWEALGMEEPYRSMRRRKNRCIRLEYAPARKFHLDVTPAIPEWQGTGDHLYVPDRQLQIWSRSHPIGFADEWFLRAAAQLPRFPVLFANRRHSGPYAGIEPLPDYGMFEKKPLQRIVQLLKRDRDEFFQDDDDHRPSSILLTTLITHSYIHQLTVPRGGLLEFIINVIAGVPDYIEIRYVGTKRTFIVQNPVNSSENFAEKWTEEHYTRFLNWQASAKIAFQELLTAKGLGVDVMLNRLSTRLGKKPVVEAANSVGLDARSLHEGKLLTVSSGRVGTAAGTTIPATVYFGK